MSFNLERIKSTFIPPINRQEKCDVCRLQGVYKVFLNQPYSAQHKLCKKLMNPLEQRVEVLLQRNLKELEDVKQQARLRVRKAVIIACAGESILSYLRRTSSSLSKLFIIKCEEAVDEQTILEIIKRSTYATEWIRIADRAFSAHCKLYGLLNPYELKGIEKTQQFELNDFFKEYNDRRSKALQPFARL